MLGIPTSYRTVHNLPGIVANWLLRPTRRSSRSLRARSFSFEGIAEALAAAELFRSAVAPGGLLTDYVVTLSSFDTGSQWSYCKP
jgi:hypothetical protein